MFGMVQLRSSMHLRAMVWVGVLCLCGQLYAASHNILLLHSYHPGYAWSDRVTSAVGARLRDELGRVDLYVEFLDAKRVDPADQHHARCMRDLLETRYRDVDLEAIIVSDDCALDFLCAWGSNLVARAPVVFCGINDYSDAHLAPLGVNHTGVVEVPDVADTLALAHRLHSAASTVYVVSDRSPTGIAKRKSVQAVELLLPGLSFVYLNGEALSTAEMLAELERVPPESIVLCTVWMCDRLVDYVPFQETYSHVCSVSPAPVYALTDTWLGHGIVGGKLVRAQRQGEMAADMVARIVKEELPASAVPLQVGSVNRYTFDWRELKRLHINASDLPEGSEILYQPVWAYHGQIRRVVVGGSAALLAVVLLTALIASHVARRRAEADEERLTFVIEATQEVIATTRPGKELIYINAAGKRLFGMDELPVPWTRVMATYAVDSQVRFEDEAMPAIMREGMWRGEMEMVRASGEHFLAHQTLIAHWGSAGQLAALSTVIRDISEEKRVERELRHRERDLRITLESIGDAVMATDEKGRITRVNQVACALTGWSPEEAVGSDILDVLCLVDAKTRDLVESPVRRAMREGRTVTLTGDNILLSRDGRELRVADSAAPIRGRDGSMQGAVMVFRDVTDEQLMQERLQHAQKLEAVGLLAGGVAHDFNNLLTGILGNAELLKRQLVDDEHTRRAEEVIKAAERAADMTRQLLAFSRKGKYQHVPVDLHEVLRDVGDLVAHSLARDVRVDCDFRATSAVVNGDPTQLHSAFLNMGVNARDAMPDGGVLHLKTREVMLDAEACIDLATHLVPGEYLEVTVADTGMGMDGATLERIFEPFFTTKEPGAGTGLGLAGVYGCVEAHDGAIQVTSEQEEGTTFVIYLPVSTEAVLEARRDPFPDVVSGEGKILVIDDEETVREVLRAGLMGMGYGVELCETGLEGVASFEAHHETLDLVILDLVMPGIDGRETFKRLQAIDPDVPVLIASGYTDNSRISELVAAGVAGSIAKPFTMERLSREVARCLKSGLRSGVDTAV